MTEPRPAELPAARYRFRCTVTHDLDLPPFAGSALRGIFGNSLKETVCETGEPECTSCRLYHSCRFPAIFAPPPPQEHPLQRFQDIPPPYVIEPPAGGQRRIARHQNWSFEFVLLGQVIEDLPLITHAWDRALASGRLGPGGGGARGDAVETLEQAAPPPATPDVDTERSIRLRLETPLRIQQRGRVLGPAQLNPRAVLMAIARRVSLLAEFHGNGPPGYDFGELARRAEQARASGELH